MTFLPFFLPLLTIGREKSAHKIVAVKPSERGYDVMPVRGIVPEEIFPLRELLLPAAGCINPFESVGIDACVIDFGRQCHRCGSEILHLFEMHVETPRLYCKFGHVDLAATWMA